MAKTITLEVTRYRPEEETEPTFQSFEVPFREDWVVLDALNYIKDKLDGSFSDRIVVLTNRPTRVREVIKPTVADLPHSELEEPRCIGVDIGPQFLTSRRTFQGAPDIEARRA